MVVVQNKAFPLQLLSVSYVTKLECILFPFQSVFTEDLIVQFLTVLLQVLLHRSHDLGRYSAMSLDPNCALHFDTKGLKPFAVVLKHTEKCTNIYG